MLRRDRGPGRPDDRAGLAGPVAVPGLEIQGRRPASGDDGTGHGRLGAGQRGRGTGLRPGGALHRGNGRAGRRGVRRSGGGDLRGAPGRPREADPGRPGPPVLDAGRGQDVRPVPGDPGVRFLGARAGHHDTAGLADRRFRAARRDLASRGHRVTRLHRGQADRPARRVEHRIPPHRAARSRPVRGRGRPGQARRSRRPPRRRGDHGHADVHAARVRAHRPARADRRRRITWSGNGELGDRAARNLRFTM